MSDHRDCPFTFQNRPARFQQPQDAEVDGVSDTLSMEIAHSPQIKYIGLAVPAHPLSGHWICTPCHQTVQNFFSSTHAYLLYCFLPPVLSLFLLPQTRPSLCSLLLVLSPSLSQGDLNDSTHWQSFYVPVTMFLVLLCFVPVALPESMLCKLYSKGKVNLPLPATTGLCFYQVFVKPPHFHTFSSILNNRRTAM